MDFKSTQLSNQIRLINIVLLTLTLHTATYEACANGTCKKYYKNYRFNTPRNSTINSTPFIHSLIERLFARKDKIFFAVLALVSNSEENVVDHQSMIDLEKFLPKWPNDNPAINSCIARMHKERWWEKEEF